MQDWRGTDIEVGSVITTGYGGRQIEGVVIELQTKDPRGVSTVVAALTGTSVGEVTGARMRIRTDRVTVIRTVAELDADIERLKEARAHE